MWVSASMNQSVTFMAVSSGARGAPIGVGKGSRGDRVAGSGSDAFGERSAAVARLGDAHAGSHDAPAGPAGSSSSRRWGRDAARPRGGAPGRGAGGPFRRARGRRGPGRRSAARALRRRLQHLRPLRGPRGGLPRPARGAVERTPARVGHRGAQPRLSGHELLGAAPRVRRDAAQRASRRGGDPGGGQRLLDRPGGHRVARPARGDRASVAVAAPAGPAGGATRPQVPAACARRGADARRGRRGGGARRRSLPARLRGHAGGRPQGGGAAERQPARAGAGSSRERAPWSSS